MRRRPEIALEASAVRMKLMMSIIEAANRLAGGIGKPYKLFLRPVLGLPTLDRRSTRNGHRAGPSR